MPHRNPRARTALIAIALVSALIAVPGAAHAAWRAQIVSGTATHEREGWNPAVAVAGDGTALAVWEGRVADGGQLLFSRRVNGMWSAPAAIPGVTRAPDVYVWHPQLALLPGGRAVVVWLQRDADPGPVAVKAIPFDGAQWGAAETVVATGAGTEGLAIAADPTGIATAVWVRSDDTIAVSRRVAGAWDPPTNYNGGSVSRSPSIVAAANGDVTVVWTADLRTYLPYVRWSAASGSWSGSAQQIPFPEAGFKTPWWAGTAIVADAAGNVTAAWTQCRYADNAPNYCHPNNPADNSADMRVGTARFDVGTQTWTTSSATGGDPAQSGDPIYEGRNPSLAQLPSGDVVAAWVGGDDGTKRSDAVYASTWSGSGWGAPQRVGAASGDLSAVGYPGGVALAWSAPDGIRSAFRRQGVWSQPSRITAGERPRLVGVADPADGYPIGALVSYATWGEDGSGPFWRVGVADLVDRTPDPVGAPRAAWSGAALAVSWDPATGVLPVTGYEVSVDGGNGAVGCPPEWDSATTSCAVTGLDPSVVYDVRVRARNGDGWGAWSEATRVGSGSASGSLLIWGNCNDASVSEYRVDGSYAADLVTGAGSGRTSGECPWGTTADVANDRLYWVDWTSGNLGDPASSIWVSGLDGSNPHVLYTDGVDGVVIKSVNGLAVDTTQSPAMLYWVNWEQSIGYARADGSGGAGVLYLGASQPGAGPFAPESFAIDGPTGRLYWSATDARIRWAPLDGSGPITDVTVTCGAVSGIYAIAVDSDADRLYRLISRGSEKVIQAMALDGSDCVDIASFTESGGATQLTYDPHDQRLYFDWRIGSTDSVRYVDLRDPSSGIGQVDIGASAATVDWVNMAFVVAAPMARTATTLAASGATVGATLTCAPAAWHGDLTGMNAYRAASATGVTWSRDGSSIPGATGETLVADAPGSYTCATTASNAAGATRSTSEAAEIAAPTGSDSTSPASAAAPVAVTASATAGRPSRAQGLRLHRGWPKQVGNTLITNLQVPGAGSVTQIAYAQQGRRKVRACSGRVTAARAGRVVVRCVLDLRVVRAAARSVRAAVAVPIVIRTTFTPASGGAASVISTPTTVRESPPRASSVTG